MRRMTVITIERPTFDGHLVGIFRKAGFQYAEEVQWLYPEELWSLRGMGWARIVRTYETMKRIGRPMKEEREEGLWAPHLWLMERKMTVRQVDRWECLFCQRHWDGEGEEEGTTEERECERRLEEICGLAPFNLEHYQVMKPKSPPKMRDD